MSYIQEKSVARLIVTCDDRPGIVCKITQFLYDHHANITALDQHSTDPENGTFFLRLEYQTPKVDLDRNNFEQRFNEEVAKPLKLQYKISYAAELKKMAILVSKHDHAFLDLLWRYKRKELPMTIPVVISNHEDLRAATEGFGIPFHYIENHQGIREQAEKQMLDLLKGVDGVIMARYMQVLSDQFIASFDHNVINIHHSFLPAFKGADPYQQAYDKGVKLIGATAHYATKDLDMGPIINQDVVPVTHRLSPAHLKELGKDIERRVLAQAVKWHLEDRIIIHDNKTIVF